jgi:hypothetical protein
MRQSDRNGGSIKALVIFALLVANIIVALSRHGTATSSRGPRARKSALLRANAPGGAR